MDIEDFSDLLCFLRKVGQIGPNETPHCEVLTGGVSNRTVLVERANGSSLVLKQALDRLRVATEWRSDPRRIEREALGLQWLSQFAPPGTIPALLFLEPRHHVLGMEAVPRPHANWKTELLAGRIQQRHIEQFGVLLGTIHRRSREDLSTLPSAFEDRSFFESLRLEPYYEYTARQVPAARPFLLDLIERTRAIRLSLVHGDYSPKNVLIHRDRLVLLDHEVIHLGDPAFDLGFSLTHLLSKAHHLPLQREDFLRAAAKYWRSYNPIAAELMKLEGFEERVVQHCLACLLARIDGRSPLEYLTAEERRRQRETVLGLMPANLTEVPELIVAFGHGVG